jgi:hypothetical protein
MRGAFFVDVLALLGVEVQLVAEHVFVALELALGLPVAPEGLYEKNAAEHDAVDKGVLGGGEVFEHG